MTMTKEQKKLIIREAKRESARRSYRSYVKTAHHGNFEHYAHTDLICDYLQRIVDGEQMHLMIEMPPRHGKQQADSTPVYTPNGWTTHGDLKVGDYVYHPNGKAIKVLWTSEKTNSDWVVTFTNGEQIRTHERHEWTVYNRNKRKFETLETQEMKDDCFKNSRCKYLLQNIKALENAEKELPIDPYTLGVWLGDGSSSKPCVTYDKKDYAMIQKVVDNGYPISTTCIHKDTNVPTTYFSGTRHNPGRMTRELTTTGLMNNKHIPDIYLQSSIEQRLQLLAGLIDSDGHCDNKSRIRYSTTNIQIRDGVYNLALSLGFRPYILESEPTLSTSDIQGTKSVYQVGFNPTMNLPTQLERKTPSRFVKQRRIGIVSVEYIPNGEQGHCIQVDSNDGLYLTGSTLLPTHNSMTVTETFPSYFLMKNPTKRVIASAYSEGLARKFGRLNRNKFEEFSNDLFNLNLSADNNSTTDWGLADYNGGMIATGIGGSITGQGADLMVIDDPIKNAKEAQSKTIRENIWDEWESTLSTRLHDGASVIVIMTRWHQDDFIGRLLEQSPYNWKRLRLPAIAEDEDDLLNREVGEPLCRELGFDEEWADLKKREVGSRTWASLYQQRPSPAQGTIFKREWVQYYDKVPLRYDDMLMSWDFTFKDSESSDYAVGQVWIKKGADFYLIDQVRAKMDFTQSVRAVESMKNKHPKCRKILIEDKANGPAIITTLKQKVSGIIPITPKDSKVARAYAVTPFFEAGNVFVGKKVPSVEDFIDELTMFDNAVHDDTVDAMTQALNYFASKPTASVITGNAW